MKLSRVVAIVVSFLALAPPSPARTAADGPTRIACLGDSVTLGPGVRGVEDLAYPARLQSLLGNHYIVRNFGYAGAGVLGASGPKIVDSLPQVAEFKPHVVIVVVGGADAADRDGTQDWPTRLRGFEKGYSELIEALTSEPQQPLVLACSPTAIVLETPDLPPERRAELTMLKPRVQELRERTRRVAAIKKVAFVDVNALLQGRPELMIPGDGAHPNADGYARLADHMAGLIAALERGQKPLDPTKPYKAIARDIVTELLRGNLEKADTRIGKFQATYPADPECWFLRSVLLSIVDQPAPAFDAVRNALASGLPFERYLAGPRPLLKNLYGQIEFWDLAKDYNIRLVHGPLLGNVTHDSAAFWFRTAVAERIAVTVKAVDSDRPAALGAGSSSETTDFTAVVTVGGLQPDTTYEYQVVIANRQVYTETLPTFRTAPPPRTHTRFRIAFGGGAGYTPWHERMWDTLRAAHPRALLMLGDNVYIDTPDQPETQRYCYYRRQSRPEWRRLTAEVPVYAIWDDHDFGGNDCTSSPDPNVPAWKPAVLDVFKQNWNNPAYGDGNTHPGVWFRFTIGDVDFFMLDCRYYRDNPRKTKDRPPSMLGAFQKAWLLNALKTSTATFKVVCGSVPWANNTKPGSLDTWDGFEAERAEILACLATERIGGVLLLSADRHRSDIRRIESPGNYPLYDFMSSRLTNVHTHSLVPGAIFAYNEKCAFGIVDFDTTRPDPTATLRIETIDGEIVYEMTLKRSELTHRTP